MKRVHSTAMVIGIAAVLSFVLGFGLQVACAASASDMKAKQIVVEAKKIKNENPRFKIKLWTEDNKSKYSEGQTITFKFSSNRDCYVTLLDIGTDGAVYKIFPNKWHTSGKIEKDKVYEIPPKDGEFTFKIKGPRGMEYVKAIATLDPLKSVPEATAKTAQDFPMIEDADVVMKNIKVEVDKKDSSTWAESLISFNIVTAPKAEKE